MKMAHLNSRDRSSSVSSPATTTTTPEAGPEDDDIWASDHENDPAGSRQGQPPSESLLSDLPTIKRQHMSDGYREGLGVGKAKVMQKGFDDGYPIGTMIASRAGRVLGCIEGVLTANDVPDERKVAVLKTYERAKSELAIAALLNNMNDQVIMGSLSIPASIERVLDHWETVTLGAMVLREGSTEIRG